MSLVSELMEKIVNFDCEQKVYDVILSRPSYLDCFLVRVIFRTSPEVSEFSIRNEDPVQALRLALGILERDYGKCPACGNYKNGVHK